MVELRFLSGLCQHLQDFPQRPLTKIGTQQRFLNIRTGLSGVVGVGQKQRRSDHVDNFTNLLMVPLLRFNLLRPDRLGLPLGRRPNLLSTDRPNLLSTDRAGSALGGRHRLGRPGRLAFAGLAFLKNISALTDLDAVTTPQVALGTLPTSVVGLVFVIAVLLALTRAFVVSENNRFVVAHCLFLWGGGFEGIEFAWGFHNLPNARRQDNRYTARQTGGTF